MQRIGRIERALVRRPGVDALGHHEAAIGDPAEQLHARPQAEVLGEVRQDQPAFATVDEVPREAGEEAAQHAAVVVVDRRFEAGARSYWHSHDRGQLLYVEAGRMWAQKRGQAKHEFGPGESDYTGPNVEHWHGATPQSHLIQVNVGFGGGTKWLEAVPEADYRK